MTIAIIGGSGFNSLSEFQAVKSHQLSTVYGEPSANIIEGKFTFQDEQHTVYFLARHGEKHSIAPHKINYRANIQALESLGVTRVIALAAVGSIDPAYVPGTIVLPHQILDYTYGREATFFDQMGNVAHAEFTNPYSEQMRSTIIQAAKQTKTPIIDEGTYAVTQGPRFESAAEIKRYHNDGATLVGMTAMPEAILAREKSIAYITIASVVNFAAGVKPDIITHNEIHAAYQSASESLYAILPLALKELEQINVSIPSLIYP